MSRCIRMYSAASSASSHVIVSIVSSLKSSSWGMASSSAADMEGEADFRIEGVAGAAERSSGKC